MVIDCALRFLGVCTRLRLSERMPFSFVVLFQTDEHSHLRLLARRKGAVSFSEI